MKILIAEDDAVCRLLLRSFLCERGHNVVEVANGVEAWQALQEDRFGMVITDWIMPEMDGVELVQRMRDTPPHENYIYAILLTARSKLEDIVWGMEAGADDFIVKPFDHRELEVRIQAGERIVSLEHTLAQRNLALADANQRMSEDLEAAAQFQQSLLPKGAPSVECANFSWVFQPCDELAGDILNVFRLDETHIGIYLLDVSGHGVSAALLSVTLSRMLEPVPSPYSFVKQTLDHEPGYRIPSPAEVLNRLNVRFPMDLNTGQYFTIVYAILDCEAGALTYASAGHPPLFHITRRGVVSSLTLPAPPIGFIADIDYEEKTLVLQPGDRVFLYSDGITEAADADDQQYGEQRMADLLVDARNDPLEQSLPRLLSDVHTWCGQRKVRDDISAVALECARKPHDADTHADTLDSSRHEPSH